MENIKFKKKVYAIIPQSLQGPCDSYKFEIYIEKNREDVKKKYDSCHDRAMQKKYINSTIQDVTLLRICQVLEKLKYMEKSPYFNLQDITVLNWLEQEFKQILKESEDSELEKSDSEKRNLKIIKKEEKNDTKSDN